MSFSAARGVSAVLAAMALTIAGAQAQDNVRQSNCQTQCYYGNCQSTCTSSTPPPAEAPFQRGPATEAMVRFNPAAEAQKLKSAKTGARIASDFCPRPYWMSALDGCQLRLAKSSDFCPPPYRMTERDGCQPGSAARR
jgi:hypothetical protein